MATEGARRPTVGVGLGRDAGFEVFSRERWIRQGPGAGHDPSAPAVAREVADGEPTDPGEVLEVYLPLARWMADRVRARPVPADGSTVAGPGPTTAVIGITGSVAVGKTTTARILSGLLRRGPAKPRVDLLTTDGFLYRNQVLEQRGLLGRKGFPESYDHRALVAALQAVRAGRPEVSVPVYSHRTYDIVPGAAQRIHAPDLLVVEGLTVLQGAPGGGGPGDLGTESLVDLAVYVDAAEEDVAHWHTERLFALRSDGAAEPSDFLRWLSSLSEAETQLVAESSWSQINLVNLREHVAPTRSRADVILDKDADHRVRRVLLRLAAPSS